MAIEKDLLSCVRDFRIALELGIHDGIVLIIHIYQHFCLCTMLLEQRAQKCCTTATVLSMIWSRRNGFERNKFLQGSDQLILVNIWFVVCFWMATRDVPNCDRAVASTCDVELLAILVGDDGSQHATFMCFPSIHTLVSLTESRRRVLEFAVLDGIVFLLGHKHRSQYGGTLNSPAYIQWTPR